MALPSGDAQGGHAPSGHAPRGDAPRGDAPRGDAPRGDAPAARGGPGPAYPLLYELNTRVYLTSLAGRLGRAATLDDIPDAELERIAGLGFDWVWLLSVWAVSPASRAEALALPDLRQSLEAELSDLTDDDIGGSGFAIGGYAVAPALGGEAALARLRARMAGHGLRLMLDFVPNHTGLDHPWATTQPERFVRGTAADLAATPGNWTTVAQPDGTAIVLAHGRDPFFPGWTDTLQLDYRNPDTVAAMADELASVAARCDGVRADMAMLLLPDVFARTWGRPALPFWRAAVDGARAVNAGFGLLAEVYWGLEDALLGLGFDWAYDKPLYDALVAGSAAGADAGAASRAAAEARSRLQAPITEQARLARFLENHDEARAAAVFSPERHEAAALVAFLAPGLRFLHQGQLEGFRVRVSPQLVRGPAEPVDARLARFYGALLALLRDRLVREGAWRLLDVTQAWDGNPTHDGFVAYGWRLGTRRLVVVVNLGATQGQGYVQAPLDELRGADVRLVDRLNGQVLARDADDLAQRGLYVDLPACGHHVLEASSRPKPAG